MQMTKTDIAAWALDQITKYGIRQPETYTEQELKDLNPEVPSKKKKVIKMLDEDDGYHD